MAVQSFAVCDFCNSGTPEEGDHSKPCKECGLRKHATCQHIDEPGPRLAQTDEEARTSMKNVRQTGNRPSSSEGTLILCSGCHTMYRPENAAAHANCGNKGK